MARKQKARTSSANDMLTVRQTNPTQIVGTYMPSGYDPQYGHNFPFFNIGLIPTILKDPKVRYGLQLIKGPIENFTVFLPEEDAEDGALHETIREQGVQFVYAVKSADKTVQELVLKTMKRFWATGLREALTAIEWGFSCSQIIYERDMDDSKKVVYKGLHLYPQQSSRPLLRNNCLIGANIRGLSGHENGLDLHLPKVLWHVHAREVHRLFGQSRCEWCFVPWHELWVQYGARDSRRTWMLRNNFDGGEMRYPIGKTKIDNFAVDNDVIAAEMMSKMRTGGFRILPYDTDPGSKEQKWQYTPPSANVEPQSLMAYPKSLQTEILEGLGIPPEVVESNSDGGFGSATGRKVPMIAYYSTLSSLVNNVIADFCACCVDFVVRVNNGGKFVPYSVERVIPLKSSLPEGPGGPGGKERKTDPVTTTESDSGLSV